MKLVQHTTTFVLLSIVLYCPVVLQAQTSTPQHPSRPQAGTRTPSPQAKLKQYLADLQSAPDDTALREKIIKCALTMKPAPAIPPEAQNELTKGIDEVKQSTGQATFHNAVARFERATLLAPWWPNAYYILAGVQEKLDKLDDARASLSLYLLAAPTAIDADAVREKIAALDPEVQLKQAVAEVRSNPNDTAAREKVIRLALAMKSPPEIPEEARRHFVMAQAFKEKATVSTGFASAIQEYKAALLAAPWWSEAYKKLAIVQKAADQYDDAIASLNLYLVSQPSDARDARDEIYKLKADKQAAAEQKRKQWEEENSPQAVAAPPQNSFEHLLRKVDGRRYVYFITASSQSMVLDVIGRFAKFGAINTQGTYVSPLIPDSSFQIIGRETTVQSPPPGVSGLTWIISEDGESITERFRYNGMNYDNVYHWQG